MDTTLTTKIVTMVLTALLPLSGMTCLSGCLQPMTPIITTNVNTADDGSSIEQQQPQPPAKPSVIPDIVSILKWLFVPATVPVQPK